MRWWHKGLISLSEETVEEQEPREPVLVDVEVYLFDGVHEYFNVYVNILDNSIIMYKVENGEIIEESTYIFENIVGWTTRLA